MVRFWPGVLLFFLACAARAQIQVNLKFQRLQYIAYEPVLAQVSITNLAGRDIDLHDDFGQHWYGFEITTSDERGLPPLSQTPLEPLHIPAGATVTQKFDLTRLYPIGDLGTYHVRANIFFADLNKFFYAPTKVFEVTNARPIWQQTVGVPGAAGDSERTFSLMTNRFSDHTSLYVRVEDKSRNSVYATYSLGRIISFDEPHTEIDRNNLLHVLQPSAPRLWSYSVIDTDGKLVKHQSYAETGAAPRLRRMADGSVTVAGGVLDEPVASSSPGKTVPKLSDRPINLPQE